MAEFSFRGRDRVMRGVRAGVVVYEVARAALFLGGLINNRLSLVGIAVVPFMFVAMITYLVGAVAFRRVLVKARRVANVLVVKSPVSGGARPPPRPRRDTRRRGCGTSTPR